MLIRNCRLVIVGWLAWQFTVPAGAEELRSIPLKAKVTAVQPMTGIVFWTTNEAVADAPIQLEYTYLTYGQVVREKGTYDWAPVENVLNEVARRKHQAVLRWHDTYVGQPNGVPAYIQALGDYRGRTALSEKQRTGFPDWSHPELQRFVLEFFTRFAEKYDRDPRIGFVQVGFGLWAEYHIYDGPLQLGKTFPSKPYQAQFARHLNQAFQQTQWMISVDAAGDHTPFAGDPILLGLKFGLFDDSFNHRRHAQENEPNWISLGLERWQQSPAGGEFSFFEPADQKQALSDRGPHGVPFARQAAKFHVSFIIGDDQLRFQSKARIQSAGLACGYRFRINRFEAAGKRSVVDIENSGIAPIYYDAFPAVNGVRSKQSLKGLLPGRTATFEIESGGLSPVLTIQSDRLVPGQQILFDADLTAAAKSSPRQGI